MSTVQLSARVAGGAALRFIASTSSEFTSPIKSAPIIVGPHNIARGVIAGLAPNTLYYVGAENLLGERDPAWTSQFRTPPAGTHNFSFAFASCSDSPNEKIYDNIAARLESGGIHFFVHLGDLNYWNINVNDEAQFHNAHDSRFKNSGSGTLTNMSAMFRNGPMYYIWDDHDYGSGNSDKTSASRPAVISAFRRRVPVTPALSGIQDAPYYSWVRGNVRFIMSDLRSEKDKYSQLIPALMFRREQERWLYREFCAAQAAGQAIVWGNTVPWINPLVGSSGSDTWAGSPEQRREIAAFLRHNQLVSRLVIIAGDMHSNAYDDGSSVNNWGDLRICHSAALSRTASSKGGPYLLGPFPGGGFGTVSNYSYINVTDTGGQTIAFRLRAVNVNRSTGVETEHYDLTFNLDAAKPAHTAPVLSSFSASAYDAWTARMSVSTTVAAGTIYAVATSSSTPPSPAQIMAEQDHTGAAAADSGLYLVVRSGAHTILRFSQLNPLTTYWVHAVHSVAGGAPSNVVSASFTTDTAANYPMNTVMIFNTNLAAGTTISLALGSAVSPYDETDVLVDWGDGSQNHYSTPGTQTHEYASNGVYTVTISGHLTTLGGNEGLVRPMLTSVLSIGRGHGLASLNSAFRSANNLTSVPAWIPGGIYGFSHCFRDSVNFNDASVMQWDVSSGERFQFMFRGCAAFNRDISGWDMSRATTLQNMFFLATSFNQPVGKWNMPCLENIVATFRNTSAFNQDLSTWDISQVRSLEETFMASAFNQNINNWDTRKLTSVRNTFNFNSTFNQTLSGWDVSRVTDFRNTFSNTGAFNQNISGWDVSRGTQFNEMFSSATAFNQNIAGWNTGNATNMNRMFRGATAFDRNLGGWNVEGVTNFVEMFQNMALSTANYDALLIGWAAQSVQAGRSFHGGNSKYTAGGAAAAARNTLISTHGWTITDGGTA